MATNQSTTLVEQKMTDGSTKLKLVSPYHPTFSPKAKAIGGTWHPTTKAWYFDPRDSERVRALCLATFGTDPLASPDEAPELVTVRWFLEPVSYPPVEDPALRAREQMLGNEAWMFGREILSRPGRDADVRLGSGVVIVAGGFAGSGGSRANPRIGEPKAGTVVEIRDVPRPMAEAHVAKHPSTCVIWETAPAAPAVPTAVAQVVALTRTMAPADRRHAIVAVIGSLDGAERRALLAEIQGMLDGTKGIA